MLTEAITRWRRTMNRRTVRAIPREDGRLELLDPVELAMGREIPVTLDLPEESERRPVVAKLPTRRLGTPKVPLTRDEIYE